MYVCVCIMSLLPVAILQLEVAAATAQDFGHDGFVLDGVERASGVHHFPADLHKKKKSGCRESDRSARNDREREQSGDMFECNYDGSTHHHYQQHHQQPLL